LAHGCEDWARLHGYFPSRTVDDRRDTTWSAITCLESADSEAAEQLAEETEGD